MTDVIDRTDQENAKLDVATLFAVVTSAPDATIVDRFGNHLRPLSSLGTADGAVPIAGAVTKSGVMIFDDAPIIPDPSNSNEAASKGYADQVAAAGRVPPLGAVLAAATGNVNLATPGSTFDGVTLANSGVDRFLALNQTIPAEGGIYIWNGASSAATRAGDADTAGKIGLASVYVSPGGSTNGGLTYQCQQKAADITLGTTALSFAKVNGNPSETNSRIAGDAAIVQSAMYAGAGLSTSTYFYTGTNSTGVAIPFECGTDIAAGASLSNFSFPMALDATATHMVFSLYSRLTASGTIDGLPLLGTDVLVCPAVTLTVAALGITPGAGGRTCQVQFPLAPLADATHTYYVVAQAFDVSNAVVEMGFGTATPGSGTGLGAHRRGWLRNDAGTWVAINTTDRWAWTLGPGAQQLANNAATTAAAALPQSASTFAGASLPVASYYFPGIGVYGAVPTVECGSGKDIPAGVSLAAWQCPIAVAIGTDHVTFALYSRITTDSTIDSLPIQKADAKLDTVTVSVTDLGLVPGAAGQICPVMFPKAGLSQAGTTYYIIALSYDASNTPTQMGWGSAAAGAGTGLPVHRRGWISSSPGTFVAILSTDRWAWTLQGGAHYLAQKNVAKPTAPPAGANIGTRILGVFGASFANGTPKTFQNVMETVAPFTAVRLIIGCPGSQAFTISKAAISTRADTNPTDNNNSATWTAVTFGGNATLAVPAAFGTFRTSWQFSDWISLASAVRTDGHPGGVAIARAYVSTAANISILALPAGYADPLANRTDNHAFGMRFNNGDCVTTIGNFTSTTNQLNSPILGLQYVAATGAVVNVLINGDSITEGVHDTVVGDAYGMPIVDGLNAVMHGAVAELSNIGWSGSPSASFLARIQDFIAAGLPADYCVYCSGTGNDTGTGTVTLTDAHITAFRTNRLAAVAAMRAAGIVPILSTWGPYGALTTPGTIWYDYQQSDYRRVADNLAIMRGAKGGGYHAVDFAGVLYGSINGNGQVQPSLSLMFDQPHPNHTGYAAMAAPLLALIKADLGL